MVTHLRTESGSAFLNFGDPPANGREKMKTIKLRGRTGEGRGEQERKGERKSEKKTESKKK